METDDLSRDRLAIRALVENWALWRDARDWDKFRTVWHEGARMQATWTEGSVEDFIRATDAGWDRGVRILHLVGGTTAEIAGDRAIAQTKMEIRQRALVENVLCDVACIARGYDFIERRQGRWAIVFREPIYEWDRIDPVTPGEVPVLDRTLLASFPEGYRHLGYLQARLGYPVRRDLPGPSGDGIKQLYARGAAWLARTPGSNERPYGAAA